MLTSNQIDLKRAAFSTLGAIILSATCIGGAVAPANAAAPNTISEWRDAVSNKLDTGMDAHSSALPIGTSADAVVAVRFTAEGDFAGAELARSSGQSALDAHAVEIARTTSYPALPPAMRGRPRTVAMRLVFGHAGTTAEYEAMRKLARPVAIYADLRSGGDLIASK